MQPILRRLELLSLILISFMVSCSKQSETTNEISNQGSKIQAQYRPYVDRFFEEAISRKANVNDSRLYVITGFPRPVYCGLGYSNYLGNGSMRVEISPEPSCWSNRNDLEKEILMFHELGHAILDRQHKEGNLAISFPVSMMCSQTCNGFFNIYNEFTPELREYYIDELFDPQTEIPSWAIKGQSNTVFQDDFLNHENEWDFVAPFDSNGIYSSERFDTLGSDNLALSVTSQSSISENTFSFWRKIIQNPNYPVGSGLRLSVELTTENLEGNGIAIALRTDSKADNGETRLSGFSTTQNNLLINGNISGATYTVNLGYFPEKVEQIQIFLLMLNETKGKAYFDNVKLELLE